MTVTKLPHLAQVHRSKGISRGLFPKMGMSDDGSFLDDFLSEVPRDELELSLSGVMFLSRYGNSGHASQGIPVGRSLTRSLSAKFRFICSDESLCVRSSLSVPGLDEIGSQSSST